ncbi:unnamed protein product [Soboliphyme baturini]|uniref:Uncharacterized protein n=1 Tax=Soboliphyme baturini TaxID=241478 RepID=A0A183IS44_9BILA|nr:unnamed protein product [Soboliphyme baturini]
MVTPLSLVDTWTTVVRSPCYSIPNPSIAGGGYATSSDVYIAQSAATMVRLLAVRRCACGHYMAMPPPILVLGQ